MSRPAWLGEYEALGAIAPGDVVPGVTQVDDGVPIVPSKRKKPGWGWFTLGALLLLSGALQSARKRGRR